MQHYKTEIASLRQKSNTLYQGLLILLWIFCSTFIIWRLCCSL